MSPRLITFVPNPSVPRPAGGQWDFTGNAENEPLWYIPFVQEVDRPWTGISTEEVTPDDFSNVKYQLTAFDGPGQMSVVDFSPFSDPNVYFQTSNGVDESNVISVPTGTHAHYSWFFTAAGTYTFDITAVSTLTDGSEEVSATHTFTFQVAVEADAIAPSLEAVSSRLVHE